MHMEDYHTEHIGVTADKKQFMGFHTFVYSPPHNTLTLAQQEEWPLYRREYVVLHLFDKQGNYLATHSWFAGTSAVCDKIEISAKLSEMIAALGKVKYQDVRIKPFRTQIDGFDFGLIPDAQQETLTLVPNGLLFEEPWDGEYYT